MKPIKLKLKIKDSKAFSGRSKCNKPNKSSCFKESIEETYPSPRWSGEITDCAHPMTFDQYDHCGYNCLYCFSWFQKSLRAFDPTCPSYTENYQKMKVRSINPSHFKKIINGGFEKGVYGQFTPFVKEKKVLQWGGLSDPFCPYEKRHGKGLECLEAMAEIDYPCTFSTKGIWWVNDPRYQKLFEGQEKWNIKMSIINLDKDKAKLMEKGVPSPLDRLKAIKELCKYNRGGVTLRLRPFILGFSDRNNEHLELIKLAHEAGATAVSTEFFCLENRVHRGTKARYEAMSEIIGFDVLDFYRRNSPRASGYLRLNENIKGKHFNQMKDLCDKLGMRFYVSDAHWKHLSHNGDCCGLPSDWNYSKSQYTEILCLARKRAETGEGLVYWSDMENGNLELYKKFLYRFSCGFNTINTRNRTKNWNITMFTYLKNIWNDPKNRKAPYLYFRGLLTPVGKDKNGDVFYKYTPYKGK